MATGKKLLSFCRFAVRFWDAVQALVGDGHRLFVELGPHPTLLPALADGLRALGVSGSALAPLRRDQPGRDTLLSLLGALYCAGVGVAWPQVAPQRQAAAALPTYPFQRERCWIESAAPNSWVEDRMLPPNAHPLLGVEQALATEAGKFLWTRTLTRASLPELVDHQVDGLVVLPGAAYSEMMLAAGVARGLGATLTNVTFAQL